MTTNRDWLFSLPLEEQYAWMNAEHQERALDGDTAAQNEDSRERLEAEIESYSAFNIMDTITLDMVIGWIDRQAAITDAEWEDELEQLHIGYKPLIDELQAQVDTLKSRHCPHYHANEHTCDVHETRIAELTAERERYREKFGKCLDYADAIHALMDDEDMA